VTLCRVAARRAQLNAPGLGGRQRGLGPLGDHPPLGLRYRSHYRDDHLVRLWHIDRDELHARIVQPGQEMRVTGEAVELGDDECCLPTPTRC
jgi:hypothetical protein